MYCTTWTQCKMLYICDTRIRPWNHFCEHLSDMKKWQQRRLSTCNICFLRDNSECTHSFLPQKVISALGVLNVFNTYIYSLWQDFSPYERETKHHCQTRNLIPCKNYSKKNIFHNSLNKPLKPSIKSLPPLTLQQNLATTTNLAVIIVNYQSGFPLILAISTNEDFTLICAVTHDRQDLMYSVRGQNVACLPVNFRSF